MYHVGRYMETVRGKVKQNITFLYKFICFNNTFEINTSLMKPIIYKICFSSEIITQISILVLNNGLAAGIYIMVSGILYHNINLKNRLVSMVFVG